MLRHSSLDDIEYSSYSPSTRKSIKKRQRRHRRHRHQHRRRKSTKFVDYGASQCAVCLDDSHALDTTLFPCGHAFHGECLIQWVRVQNGRQFNCPLCRQDIAHFVPTSSNQPYVQITRPFHEQTYTFVDDASTSEHSSQGDVSALKRTSVNLRAGLFAGLAAGTTTYMVTANKLFVASALRGSLLPVLSETVPSVAVFFTSYEALKHQVFSVDQTDKSTLRTFSERFAAASIASTLGFVAPAVVKTGGLATVQGLLPLRFAAFFRDV